MRTRTTCRRTWKARAACSSFTSNSYAVRDCGERMPGRRKSYSTSVASLERGSFTWGGEGEGERFEFKAEEL